MQARNSLFSATRKPAPRAFLVLTEIAKPPAPPAQPPIKGTLGAVGPGERVAQS